MKQPKIHVLINWLKSGGAEKQSILLSAALNKSYPVTLVCFNTNDNDPKLLDLIKKKQVFVKYIGGNFFSKSVRYFLFVLKDKPTIIFSYLAFTNLLNALIGKLTQVQFRIGGIRNSHHSKLKLILQRFLHNHLLTASISNSYSGKQIQVENGFNEKTILVIPNSFIIKSGLIKRTESTPVKILTVGRFVEQKNYPAILEMFKICTQQNKNLKLIIVGFGNLENQIRQRIEKLELSQFVEMIINPVNIDDYYKQADIYLSASLFEGLSNSIMEAMSFSLPIVATDVGDNNRLVLNGQNGFIVKLGDNDSITQHLLLLANNYQQRIKMGEKSYHHITQNFSDQAFSKKYLNLIQNDFKA